MDYCYKPTCLFIHDSIAFYAKLSDMLQWCFEYSTVILSVVFLTPIAITLILPIFMLAVLYTCALYLKAYRYYFKANGHVFTPADWQGARNFLAYLYDAQGRFWHGYEIQGFENIPADGPALIVFYHGALPVDWYYLLANTILRKKRLICAVGDRLLFKIPGFDAIIDCLQVHPGSVDICADMLRKGNLLAIAPGGVREAIFGDENYPLMWASRVGFAKVAVEAKVPIIPVFTKNIREAFFTLKFGKKWLRRIYERTRIPLVPIYGGFPVKLTTIVGKAIPHDPDCSAEEMAERVAESINNLINLHQQTPGSIIRSVKERIQYLMKRKCS